MGYAEWGSDPEFFGPRHAFREGLILRALRTVNPPALQLDCAAGVGSLALGLARRGRTVIAADLSLRSLAVIRRRAVRAGLADRVLPVVADIRQLPFADASFPSVSTAETLEHVAEEDRAVGELARVTAPGGRLVGTVPHDPRQWSAWDDWAGHLRRYTRRELEARLRGAGLEPRLQVWGWPLVRLYDGLFLKRINRRRLVHEGSTDTDAALRSVQGLGGKRWLVRLVTWLFNVDRLFTGVSWGVGLLFTARKKKP